MRAVDGADAAALATGSWCDTARLSGDAVLARFADLPCLLALKRAVRPAAPGWWLRSDNAAAGGDSSVHGPGTVLARAVLVLPGGRARPRRLRPGAGPYTRRQSTAPGCGAAW